MLPSMSMALGCRLPGEYEAAALDLAELEEQAGAPVVPVLCTGEPWAVRSAAALRARLLPYRRSRSLEAPPRHSSRDRLEALRRASLARAPEGGSACCVIRAGDEAALMGAVHALVRRKRLLILEPGAALDSVGGELGSAGSVTFVLSPRECARVGGDTLFGFMGQWGGRPWGVLTASGPEELSALVARSALRVAPPAARAVLYRVESPGTLQLACLEERLLPTRPSEQVRELTRSAETLVIFHGHGRSYCAMDGNLCSRSEPAEVGDPRCIHGLDCLYAQGPRVPARALRADIVLLNGCATAAFRSCGPDARDSRNLAVQLLDGFSSAVVSPYRNYLPSALSPYLAWHLASRGEPLGRLCQALNEHSRARSGTVETYLLLGDPDSTVFTPERATLREPRELPVRGQGPWEVELPMEPGRTRTFRLEGLEPPPSGRLHLLLPGALAARALVEVSAPQPSTGAREVLIAWDERVPAGSTSATLTALRPLEEETLSMVGAFLEALRSERHWFEPCAQAAAALEERVRSLEPVLTAAQEAPLTSAELFLSLVQAEEELVAACEQLSGELVAELARRAQGHVLWLSQELMKARGLRCTGSERVAETCPRCGSGLVRWSFQAGLWPAQTRQAWECERCLIVADAAQGLPRVDLEAPEEVYPGRPFEIRLRARNAGRSRALVAAAVVFDGRLGEPEGYRVAPSQRRTLLEPGGELELRFEAHLGEQLRSHSVYLHGLMLFNGRLSCALKRLNLVRWR